MTNEQLRRAYHTKPFKPFKLHLADGRQINVPSPEFITVPPQAARTFSVFLPEENAHDIIDLLLVVSLTHPDAQTQSASRGGEAA